MCDPSVYHVGWICAVLVEYVAAQQFLDEKHDSTGFVAQDHDDNDYIFGRIGKHNVVIAVLPDGEYGISNAASVARDMVRSFRNLRLGLMVGIGGGAPLLQDGTTGSRPKLKRDIRLGDVVVSSPGDGQGGVYQYDYGKAIQDQKFYQTGHLNSPPKSLLATVAGLRAQIEADGHTIREDINTILAKNRRLRAKYQYPGHTADRLHISSCVHPVNDNRPCEEVCGSHDGDIIERAPRTDVEDDPAIHYGLIASANSLMKDAKARDALAMDRGVLCFEMEAAGLMNQFPFLVIRGICDYADSHKNKQWQGYAAMTAAAYAKQLLLRLAPTKVEMENGLGASADPAPSTVSMNLLLRD